MSMSNLLQISVGMDAYRAQVYKNKSHMTTVSYIKNNGNKTRTKIKNKQELGI